MEVARGQVARAERRATAVMVADMVAARAAGATAPERVARAVEAAMVPGTAAVPLERRVG